MDGGKSPWDEVTYPFDILIFWLFACLSICRIKNGVSSARAKCQMTMGHQRLLRLVAEGGEGKRNPGNVQLVVRYLLHVMRSSFVTAAMSFGRSQAWCLSALGGRLMGN